MPAQGRGGPQGRALIPVSCPAPALLTPEELMSKLGGYANRDAFMRSVRRAGLRRIRVNSRVIRFDVREVEAWLRRRAA